MDIACVTCGNVFATNPKRPAKTCSRSCAQKFGWTHRPAGVSYTKQYIPGHPLAGARDAVGEHRAVLYAKIGPGTHPCHWCDATVEWLPVGSAMQSGSLKVDHLDGDPRNNVPDNLVASCNGCNVRRGLSNQIGDGELFIIRGGKRLRAERRTCEECDAPFLHRIAAANPGRFCSKACSNRVTARNR